MNSKCITLVARRIETEMNFTLNQIGTRMETQTSFPLLLVPVGTAETIFDDKGRRLFSDANIANAFRRRQKRNLNVRRQLGRFEVEHRVGHFCFNLVEIAILLIGLKVNEDHCRVLSAGKDLLST